MSTFARHLSPVAILVAFASAAGAAELSSEFGAQYLCVEREAAGKLIRQQLRRTVQAIPQAELPVVGSTAKDCRVRAGGTEIQVVIANFDDSADAIGPTRTGFTIHAIDPEMRIRVVSHPEIGTALRLERNYSETDVDRGGFAALFLGTKSYSDCIYDTVYITARCEVLDPRAWDEAQRD